jgi:alkylation response protein AidB-like acyl-CoA dehydrogenase
VDFAWTDEQQALRASITRFARQELNANMIERDQREEFAWDAWKRCAQMGIQALPLPQEYGGSGSDALTIVATLEALGYGCTDNGLLFSINAHMWASEIPILTFGTEAQKEHYLSRLGGGDWVGAHAMTEPDSGSDAYSLRTRAERRGDHWVLNGRKMFITNAPIADVVIVFATVDPALGPDGVTAFLVDPHAAGFSVSRTIHKMGLRTSPMGEVVLEDCEVPAEGVLGKIGGGPAIFTASMEWERTCILASQLGAMQRLLENATKYARERRQFGRAIGEFSGVASKLAEMEVRLESARLLIYKAAWQKARGKRALREASIAKLFVAEASVTSCLEAIQIHGGYGYMTEFQIERELRDAVAGKLYSGTSEIQKLIIAGMRGVQEA